ncbi:MAG: TlpA family protein disulfide reductase [Gammaproteobacteria bacterium]|nr:TlpA family protein disulfide reductase [Gammaproteobacteria bacterium]
MINKYLAVCFGILFLTSTQGFAKPAPNFSLVNAAGTQVSLNDYKGKVVLIDFWASWCIPCRLSFPWMNDMQQKYQRQGLEVVSINLDKEPAERQRFLKKYNAKFTVLIDAEGKTPEQYKVLGMPTSYLLNRSGEIVTKHIGFKQSKTTQYEAEILAELNK